VIELLEKEYGVREWHADEDAVDVLIGTILSQNTSDSNSHRAFAALKSHFGSWEAVAAAPADQIAQAIKCGGLAQIKATRIKQVLHQIQKEQGNITLDFLKSKSMLEAEDFLMRLPGVGHKTAACVLLFALRKPSIPVDTHVFRVAKRLGLVDSNVSPEKAHELLQEQVPPAKAYQFHVHLIEHGRKVCRARQPRCHKCILSVPCPSSLY